MSIERVTLQRKDFAWLMCGGTLRLTLPAFGHVEFVLADISFDAMGTELHLARLAARSELGKVRELDAG